MRKSLKYNDLKIFRVSAYFREIFAENYKTMKNNALQVKLWDFLARARVIIYIYFCAYIYFNIYIGPKI